MTDTGAKTFSWFGKIGTEGEALKTIKDISNGFYALAAIQGVLGLVVNAWAILDGVAYAVLALLLRKLNSRLVAIILVALSCFALVSTGMNVVGLGKGGRNIVLAIIVFGFSIRAVQATFALHRLRGFPSQVNSSPTQ